MIPELGHLALILALILATAQAAMPLAGSLTGNRPWMIMARPLAYGQFVFVAIAFAALVEAFLTSDFSVLYVAQNSNTLLPDIYKFSAVWGGHEGSLLLWALMMAGWGAAVAAFSRNLPLPVIARVISVMGMVAIGFLLFMLLTSNPFERLFPVPPEGRDLNPLLQDFGLAIHPPMLYMGYVGFSVAFSFAIAALIGGKLDAAWARWSRPWTTVAWVFLTIGIALGSWWAYYELGWGGFWFWDPVENASFMPWLLAAALLHCAIVVEKREALKNWTILLAILAFGFSLIGTFIVRSGVLTSVHAFANDPERGVYILAITGLFVGGALTLYAARASAMEAKGVFGVVSRESALVANNILLAVSCFVVFVGTIWPLVAELAFDRKLSVGPPFFDAAFTPFMVALMILLPVGGMLPWKRARLGRAMQPLWGVLALALAAGGLTWAIQTGQSLLAPLGMTLALWVIGGAAVDLWSRSGKGAPDERLRRLRALPGGDWGKSIAHAGLGITALGVAGLTQWEVEDIRVAQPGERYTVEAFGPWQYDVRLNAVNEVEGPNYVSTMASIDVFRGDRQIAHLEPEKRVYPVAGMPTTEAAIDNGILRDVYIVIGDPQANGGWAVRTYIKPLANWIWAGCIVMAIGGMVSLSDRRYRVAAGARKAAPAPGGVPAE